MYLIEVLDNRQGTMRVFDAVKFLNGRESRDAMQRGVSQTGTALQMAGLGSATTRKPATKKRPVERAKKKKGEDEHEDDSSKMSKKTGQEKNLRKSEEIDLGNSGDLV